MTEQAISASLDQMNCLADQSQLIPVAGEYEDLNSKTFSINFESCDVVYYANCKTIDEVTEWLK